MKREVLIAMDKAAQESLGNHPKGALPRPRLPWQRTQIQEAEELRKRQLKALEENISTILRK